ncbi:MAG: SGNH/GDSL hydrolase family protein [Promethearchaeota archaeon]
MSWINKSIKYNLMLIIFSTIVGLLIGEIALRLILPPKIDESKIIKKDTILMHTLIPNKDHGINAEGFNNDKILQESEIVTLGDSHTFGSTDGSWPIYLSQLLDKNVYNMGVGGYGPAQYYYLLDKALSLKPKIIIIGLYLGNDLWDSYNMVYYYDYWKDFRSENFVDDKPSLKMNAVSIRFKKIRDFLNNHSALYDFLGDRTLILREKLGLSKPRHIGERDWSNNDPDISLAYNDNSNIKTIFWSASRFRGMDIDNKNIQEGFRLTIRFLDLIKEKVEASNTELVVVFIPTKEKVYEKMVGDRAYQNKFYKGIIQNEDIIKKSLFLYCKENNIYCHDILTDLQSALKNNIKLYPETFNDHPLLKGYKIYAESIYRFLKDNNLI